jgi:hypothetical protein
MIDIPDSMTTTDALIHVCIVAPPAKGLLRCARPFADADVNHHSARDGQSQDHTPPETRLLEPIVNLLHLQAPRILDAQLRWTTFLP